MSGGLAIPGRGPGGAMHSPAGGAGSGVVPVAAFRARRVAGLGSGGGPTVAASGAEAACDIACSGGGMRTGQGLTPAIAAAEACGELRSGDAAVHLKTKPVPLRHQTKISSRARSHAGGAGHRGHDAPGGQANHEGSSDHDQV